MKTISILVLLSSVAAAGSPKSDAQKWVDARQKSGLCLVENFAKSGFRQQKSPGSNRLELNRDGYWISLGFKDPVKPGTTLQQLRRQFKYAALNKLPTPGLTADKWEFTPRTSTSSFTKGVELMDFRDGRIIVRIKTEFFAVDGRDTSVLVPADAAAPATASFRIRKPLQLDLTISCPVEF